MLLEYQKALVTASAPELLAAQQICLLLHSVLRLCLVLQIRDWRKVKGYALTNWTLCD